MNVFSLNVDIEKPIIGEYLAVRIFAPIAIVR